MREVQEVAAGIDISPTMGYFITIEHGVGIYVVFVYSYLNFRRQGLHEQE
jgi:hypothetical protein